MPVTFDATVGKSKAADWSRKDKLFPLRAVIDLDDYSGIASNDVVQCIPVAAGTFVQSVIVRMIDPAEGTSGSMTVGDADNADGYDTSVNLKGAAGTVTYPGPGITLSEGTPNTVAQNDAYFGGKYYAADDTIDVTVTLHADLTVKGKFEITAICCDIL